MPKQHPIIDTGSLCCSPLTRQPLTEAQSVDLAHVFKALGDLVSHHLKVLREAGIIDGQRRDTWVYYRVRPIVLQRLSSVLMRLEQAEPVTT